MHNRKETMLRSSQHAGTRGATYFASSLPLFVRPGSNFKAFQISTSVREKGRGGKRKFKWFTLDGELINLQRISENFFA